MIKALRKLKELSTQKPEPLTSEENLFASGLEKEARNLFSKLEQKLRAEIMLSTNESKEITQTKEKKKKKKEEDEDSDEEEDEDYEHKENNEEEEVESEELEASSEEDPKEEEKKKSKPESKSKPKTKSKPKSKSKEEEEEEEEEEESQSEEEESEEAKPSLKKENKTKTISKQAKTNQENKKYRKYKEKWNRYIIKVLKQQHPTLRLHSNSLVVLNGFINDILAQLSSEASHLMKINKSKTIGWREMEHATKLILSGELAKRAREEGFHRLKTYFGTYKQKFETPREFKR